jgi:hypothetical protein
MPVSVTVSFTVILAVTNTMNVIVSVSCKCYRDSPVKATRKKYVKLHEVTRNIARNFVKIFRGS